MKSEKISQPNCLKLYPMEDAVMLWCGIHWQDLERIKTTDSKALPKELKTAYRRIKTMLLKDIQAGNLNSVMQDGVTRAAPNLSTGHQHFYHFWHDDLIAYVEQYHPHNRPDFLFNTNYFQNLPLDNHHEKTEPTENQAFHAQPEVLEELNQTQSVVVKANLEAEIIQHHRSRAPEFEALIQTLIHHVSEYDNGKQPLKKVVAQTFREKNNMTASTRRAEEAARILGLPEENNQ